MQNVTKETLVKAIYNITSQQNTIATSREIKDFFDNQGINWGHPHGWPLKMAEEEERSCASPRIIKYKKGNAPNSMVGFARQEHESEANYFAKNNGWTRK